MEKLASQSWQGDHGNGVNQLEAVRRTKTEREERAESSSSRTKTGGVAFNQPAGRD